MASRALAYTITFALASSLFLTVAPAARAGFVIADATFNTADWSKTVRSTTGGATDTVQQLLAGGNPDAFRQMTHTLPSPSSISVVHLFLASAYDPSISGPITSIDYREDQIEFSPPFSGAAIGALPALRQDGVFYFGPDVTFSDLSWHSVELTGLTAADFGPIGNQPDFSSSGGVIQFGFLRSNTNVSVSQALQTQHGTDNWSVTVNSLAVPTLGGQGFVLLAVLLAATGYWAFWHGRLARV